MYRNHTVLKRQLAQWVQVESFMYPLQLGYAQQLKILEDMFVESILLVLKIYL